MPAIHFSNRVSRWHILFKGYFFRNRWKVNGYAQEYVPLPESINVCSKNYYFIFNPGISGVVSTSSKSFTISSVPCLYFWKWGVFR